MPHVRRIRDEKIAGGLGESRLRIVEEVAVDNLDPGVPEQLNANLRIGWINFHASEQEARRLGFA